MSDNNEGPAESGRRRRTPFAIGTGLLASVVLTLGPTGTLSGFTARITNDSNAAASGTLVMQEQNATGTVTCSSLDGAGNDVNTNVSSCSSINKYGNGATLAPGGSVSTTITIKNVGNVPANTFTLVPGNCSQSSVGAISGNALDFCSKLAVAVTQTVGGTSTLVSGANSTAASLASGGPINLTTPVNPGVTVTYTFLVSLPSTLTNAYQGLGASQPLTWQFSS